MIVCNKCFINSCDCKDNELIEIDDKILDTIRLLNSKGYATDYCCSGHYGQEQAYIMFNRTYIFDEKTLPKGFYIDNKNCYRIYPRTTIHSKDFYMLDKEITKDRESIYEYIAKINKEFYDWALALPDITKEEDECGKRYDKYKVVIALKSANEDIIGVTLDEDTSKRVDEFLATRRVETVTVAREE